MTPRELSEELRNDSSPDLQRRRWVIGLSLVGTAMAQIVSLYQTGIVRRLPDPPWAIFDSTKVDASDYAYKRLQTPDAFMMLASYAVTAWLAGAGGKNRAMQTPLLPVALGLKTVLDTVTAVELGREEWKENKALCAYCQVATICSVISVALTAPEAVRAAKSLFASRAK
ncbi:MAG TPA: vitamin K epoxide reductase family protein [Abditibacteriaceae bacterium]